MLELQEYFRLFGLEKTCQDFNLKSSVHPKLPLISIKYNQIESDFSKKEVQQARGIIFDTEDNWNIVSCPYFKFFNYGEKEAAVIDWDNARIFEKIDGSCCQFFNYKNEWKVATLGSVDASGPVEDWGFDFNDLFWLVFEKLNYKLPVEKDITFIFELCTQYNRIVVQHIAPRLVLTGGRNNSTLEELTYEQLKYYSKLYNWELVKSYKNVPLEELLKKVNEINGLEQEGFVVCDNNFNRIKIKSKDYVKLHYLKSTLSKKNMLEIIINNESQEFLNYFPEMRGIFNEMKTKYELLKNSIQIIYEQIMKEPPLIRKDFAFEATRTQFSGILFQLYDGKTINDAMRNIRIETITKLLEI